MKHAGEISEISGEYAYVSIKGDAACANCASCGGSCAKARTVKVKNTLGLKRGDNAIVAMNPAVSVLLSVVAFVVPVIILMVSYAFTKNEFIALFSMAVYVLVLVFLDKPVFSRFNYRMIGMGNHDEKM